MTALPDPYQNVEAEEALLGGLLLSPQRWADVDGVVRPQDFASSAYGHVFAAIESLRRDGKPLDLLLLRDELVRAGRFEEIGGGQMLSLLVEAVPSGAHVAYYANVVRERSGARSMRSLAENLLADLDAGKALPEVQARALTDLQSLESGSSLRATRLADVPRRGGPVRRISTGLQALDQALGGGIGATDLFVLGAPPKVGKSQFALQVCTEGRVLEPGQNSRPVRALFVGLEMSEVELRTRIIARLSGVDSLAVAKLYDGTASDATVLRYGSKVEVAEAKAEALSLLLYCRPVDVYQLRGLVASLRRELDLVVLDYLQLLSPTGRGQTDFERVSEASRACKLMAQEFGLPVLAVSQLSRPNKNAAPRPPSISDLRSSGQLEQDANQVLLLWRDPVKADENGRGVVPVRFDLAANRAGPTWWDEVAFNRDCGWFREYAHKPEAAVGGEGWRD